MTDEDIKEMNKVARMINGGAIAEKFDFVIEQIGRIAVDYRISTSIHKVINPMLNDMIRQLNSMRNNVMACMIGKDDTPMKVAQPINKKEDDRMTTRESIKMASRFLYECPVCKGHLKYLIKEDARVDVDCACEQCGKEYTMSDLYRRR